MLEKILNKIRIISEKRKKTNYNDHAQLSNIYSSNFNAPPI